MQLKFPLKDVNIEISDSIIEVENALYDDGFYRLNQYEFSMHVEDVGSFYASGGNYISLVLNPKASIANIELYLNGSTYGAILHQRKVMPMHGSCFVYDNMGIMLCGESGAGKSSLTAAFALDGNDFLTDDVTPVLFANEQTFIWTMSDRIKLWEDSLKQLKQNKEVLDKITPDTEKFYYPIESYKHSNYRLNHIFLLEKHDSTSIVFQEIEGAEKIIALRKEVYRLEYLQGMPENEAHYFKNLVQMSKNTRITKLYRPTNIPIERTKSEIEKYLKRNYITSKVLN